METNGLLQGIIDEQHDQTVAELARAKRWARVLLGAAALAYIIVSIALAVFVGAVRQSRADGYETGYAAASFVCDSERKTLTGERMGIARMAAEHAVSLAPTPEPTVCPDVEPVPEYDVRLSCRAMHTVVREAWQVFCARSLPAYQDGTIACYALSEAQFINCEVRDKE